MESSFRLFPDVVKEANVTSDKARYWLSLLKIEVKKNGRNRCLTQEEARQLIGMARLVDEGNSPQQAAAVLKAATITESSSVSKVSGENSQVAVRLESIEKAILALAENFRQEMRSLKEENQALQKSLEYRQVDPAMKSVTPEKPMIPYNQKAPPPIRATVLESSQRKISFWESVTIGLNDFTGFVFGKG